MPSSADRAPTLFRVLIPVENLPESVRFYQSLLGVRGRRVAPGRVYFTGGTVILGVLDFSATPARRRPRAAEALYFSTSDLDGVYRRAVRMGCLSGGLIHGDPASPAGKIVVRPWGERSFYVTDPSGNPLCFVDVRTKFTGTPRQISDLKRKARPN